MFTFVLPERQVEEEIKLSENDTDKKILCRVCKTKIGEEQNIFAMGDDTPYHTFVNPSGYQFNVITIVNCQSLIPSTPPISDFSWFPGYTWEIVCCFSCFEHLGWRFKGAGKTPSSFFGLIREKIEFAKLN